jgi:uncharacterized protein YdhG (YjbR/CyaY superfamily)
MRRDKRIDAYIAALPPNARAALRKIRSVLHTAAPRADETISYRIPAVRGHGILLYFAAFKKHIGMFPPVCGDEKVNAALARFRGPKGNLRFPLDEPMPLALIARIAKLRARQDREKAGAARSQR